MTSDERDAVVGRCVGCSKDQRASQQVFFGPGAAVKCLACGAWHDDEWLREAERFSEIVRARSALARPLRRSRTSSGFAEAMGTPRPELTVAEKVWLRAAGAFGQQSRRFQITTNPKTPHV